MITTRIGKRNLLRSCVLAFVITAVTGAVAPSARCAPGTPAAVRGDADQFIAELEPAVAETETRERQGQIDRAPGAEALGAPAPVSNGAGAASQPILGGAAGPRAAALVIPGATLVAGTHVEYYVRALNAPGSVLAESGTPTTLPFPLQIAAPAIAGGSTSAGAPSHTPWFKRWWVWTIVGAVALGGSVAAYAGTRGDGLTTYMTQTKQ